MILDYVAPGKHLLLDGVVKTTYKNNRLRESRSIPGYATKFVEDRKFYADKNSERPFSTCHGGRNTMAGPLCG